MLFQVYTLYMAFGFHAMLQNNYDITRGNKYCSENRGVSFTIMALRVHLRCKTESSSPWTLTGTKYVYFMTRGD